MKRRRRKNKMQLQRCRVCLPKTLFTHFSLICFIAFTSLKPLYIPCCHSSLYIMCYVNGLGAYEHTAILEQTK